MIQMTESGWERSGNIHRRRLRILCITAIPAAVLVTILYFNNQDFFRTSQSENRESEKQARLQTESAANSSVAPVSSNEDALTRIDDSGKYTIAVHSPLHVVVKNVVQEPVALPDTPDPVLISGITCEISDRDDLLVNVSLKIGFNEESSRSEILLRRNEIKVLTKKTISIKELSVVKKEILEPELKNAISGLFGRELINKVTISDLQIEKVD